MGEDILVYLFACVCSCEAVCERSAAERSYCCCCVALIALPGGDGRSLMELPVQTLSSWKPTVTTGPLCLRGGERGRRGEGRTAWREGREQWKGWSLLARDRREQDVEGILGDVTAYEAMLKVYNSFYAVVVLNNVWMMSGISCLMVPFLIAFVLCPLKMFFFLIRV